jgi:hydrogenase maturation protein HypF
LEPILTGIVTDLKKSLHFSKISAKFHQTIIEMILNACLQMRSATQLNQVVLSGGVFQNVFLLTRLLTCLRSQQFQVWFHHLVPPNDGGISLGQAVIADQKFKQALA